MHAFARRSIPLALLCTMGAACVAPTDTSAPEATASSQAADSTTPWANALGTLGDLSNAFGVFSGVQTLLTMADVIHSPDLEKEIKAVETEIRTLEGQVTGANQQDILANVSAHRIDAQTAIADLVSYVDGTPTASIDFADGETRSRDAVNKLLFDDYGCHERLVNANVDITSGVRTTPPGDPFNPYVQPSVFDGPYVWDSRLFLPSLVEAIDARLAYLMGTNSEAERDGSVADELNPYIAQLQTITDKIVSMSGCTADLASFGGQQTGPRNYQCTHQLYPGRVWSTIGPGGTVATIKASLEAQRQAMYADVGVVDLLKLVARLRAYVTPVDPLLVTGDFDGDKRTDVALIGGGNWGSVPVAFSNGAGGFRVTNAPVDAKLAWMAHQPGVQVAATDLNADGRQDLLLVGAFATVKSTTRATPANTTIAELLSNGDGSFHVYYETPANLAQWSLAPGAKLLADAFDGGRVGDMLLAGGQGWNTVPVGTGSAFLGFKVTNDAAATFASWAGAAGTQLVVGKFDGANHLVAVAGLASGFGMALPVNSGSPAFTFDLQSPLLVPGGATASASTVAGSTALAGDFDGNGYDDIAVWTKGTASIAYGNDGAFPPPAPLPIHVAMSAGARVPELTVPGPIVNPFPTINVKLKSVTRPSDAFSAYLADAGATPVAGDFNGDGITDFAGVGGRGWSTIPVAFSRRGGGSTITNQGVASFPTWAQQGLRPRR